VKKYPAFIACFAALLAWAPVQAQEPRTIRFGHLNNPDHPISLGVKRFSELVAARSGGKLVVQEFPASALGNELQQQSALLTFQLLDACPFDSGLPLAQGLRLGVRLPALLPRRQRLLAP